MIGKKHKHLMGSLLLGACFLFVPAVHAFDAAGLKKTTQALEDEFERLPPNAPKRLDLLQQIEANQKILEEAERRKAAELQLNIQQQKAANPLVERQAQVLEASQKFLPDEIARMRGSVLAVNPEETQTLREKSLKDEAFLQQIAAINQQIAAQQEALRNLQAQRAEIISRYNQDIKNLALRKDLPFKPVAAPPPPVLENKRATVSVSSSAPTSTRSGGSITPDSHLGTGTGSLGTGTGRRLESNVDFHAH